MMRLLADTPPVARAAPTEPDPQDLSDRARQILAWLGDLIDLSQPERQAGGIA